MSIEETIAVFESSKRAKERQEEEKVKAEQDHKDAERIRWAGNAKRVERHLRSVVLPALEASRERLGKLGYSCDLESVMVHDPAFGGSETTFALRLNLRASAGEETGHSVLAYEGQFDSVTIRKTETFPVKGRRIRAMDDGDDGFRPLSQYNAETIVRHVEEFVAVVFKPL